MPKDLAELFGVYRDRTRWERPLLIMAVVLGASLLGVLLPGVSWSSSPFSGSQPEWHWSWPSWGPPTYVAFNLPLFSAFTAVWPFLGFLILRRTWFAISFASVIGGLTTTFSLALVELIQFGSTPLDDLNGQWLLGTLERAGISAVVTAIGLTCLSVALRLIQPFPLALYSGYAVGATLSFFCWQIPPLLRHDNPTPVPAFLVWLAGNIMESLFLATLLWIGLRLTTSRLATSGPRRRMSHGYYTGVIFSTALVGMLLVIVGVVQVAFGEWKDSWRYGSPDLARFTIPLLFLVGYLIVCEVWHAVTLIMTVYKSWAAVRNEPGAISPGWAVGGLFIPFFNFYWVFRVFVGFTSHFNARAARSGIGRRLGRGVPIAFCVLQLLAAMPLVGLVFALPNVFVRTVLVGRMCDAANGVYGEASS